MTARLYYVIWKTSWLRLSLQFLRTNSRENITSILEDFFFFSRQSQNICPPVPWNIYTIFMLFKSQAPHLSIERPQILFFPRGMGSSLVWRYYRGAYMHIAYVTSTIYCPCQKFGRMLFSDRHQPWICFEWQGDFQCFVQAEQLFQLNVLWYLLEWSKYCTISCSHLLIAVLYMWGIESRSSTNCALNDSTCLELCPLSVLHSYVFRKTTFLFIEPGLAYESPLSTYYRFRWTKMTFLIVFSLLSLRTAHSFWPPKISNMNIILIQ